jgi:hypothetical protein
VANERLGRMMVEAAAIRKLVTLATTTAGTSTYTLDPAVARVLKAKAVYSTGQVNYEGAATVDELWNADAALATSDPCGSAYFVVIPDADDSETTATIRFWPTPAETGVTITGIAVVQPATFTYGSSSALPLDLNLHEYLLAGAKAELSDQDERQDVSAKFEAVFQAGIQKLAHAVTNRGKGTAPHRMRASGYDYSRR